MKRRHPPLVHHFVRRVDLPTRASPPPSGCAGRSPGPSLAAARGAAGSPRSGRRRRPRRHERSRGPRRLQMWKREPATSDIPGTSARRPDGPPEPVARRPRLRRRPSDQLGWMRRTCTTASSWLANGQKCNFELTLKSIITPRAATLATAPTRSAGTAPPPGRRSRGTRGPPATACGRCG